MRYQSILHIDDDKDDCDLFLQALRNVSAAAYCPINNPVDALQRLTSKTIKPDIIFLDINMPLMSGTEFLIEIKKNNTLKNIPIIIFSTSSNDDIKQKAKDLGAFDYISKPNDFHDLEKIVSDIFCLAG